MDPQSAAAIVMGSSKTPQQKPKSKTDRFEIMFTCNVCEGRNSHSISRHAYRKGTVIVVCPGCKAAHLIADNLNWIEKDFKNLEQYMAKQGTSVKRIEADGVAKVAAEEASKLLGDEDEQAARIRAAVAAFKKRPPRPPEPES